MNPADRAFHSQLVRLAKGMFSAWEHRLALPARPDASQHDDPVAEAAADLLRCVKRAIRAWERWLEVQSTPQTDQVTSATLTISVERETTIQTTIR